MPDSTSEDIEEPLEYGDSRSQRITGLVMIGLAVERLAMQQDPDLEPVIESEDADPIIEYAAQSIGPSKEN